MQPLLQQQRRLLTQLRGSVQRLKSRNAALRLAAGLPVEQRRSHYDDVAAGYEEAFFYQDGSDYNAWYLTRVQEALQLKPESRFADIGVGTGNFTAALAKEIGLEDRPLNVEPFAEMLKQSPPSLDRLQMDAVAFSQEEVTGQAFYFDRILLKEVIHHVETEKLQPTFEGLRRRLSGSSSGSSSRLVIVTRPSKESEIEYPLFQKAFKVWEENQLDHGVYAKCLRDAGFSEVGEGVTRVQHSNQCSLSPIFVSLFTCASSCIPFCWLILFPITSAFRLASTSIPTPALSPSPSGSRWSAPDSGPLSHTSTTTS